MADKKGVTGPASQGYSSAPPPQGNPQVQAPQPPYGVVPGIHGAAPYMIPGQAQIYPQGPPPTYDQALTHPAIVGQPIYPPSASMYATGYPSYIGYPTYAPMQFYPTLGAYSYAMQPTQIRPTIMIPNGFDSGARFDGLAQPVLPPAPPGVQPNGAQLAAMAGHTVALGQKKGSFLGSADGGYTFW
ncbi:DAZ-associated protein 2 [Onthophagus taurus]|uniref:DAZ-associated protein 2 n=1 Tax=Onthophagus taurus TaxID=166361 RepID=UPI000C1FEF15|nr:DAZ-associated protein 2-like [Onthophagus taurus]